MFAYMYVHTYIHMYIQCSLVFNMRIFITNGCWDEHIIQKFELCMYVRTSKWIRLPCICIKLYI